MQIVEMSDKPPKPADGMAVDKSLPHLSKPAGGSICKIQQISSEEMDGKGSTPQGTENIPKKPPLHGKLTGLFPCR